MHEFKVGDVVALKSGGPTMTVTAVGRDNGVDVVWFDDAGRPQRVTFDARTLAPFDQPSPR